MSVLPRQSSLISGESLQEPPGLVCAVDDPRTRPAAFATVHGPASYRVRLSSDEIDGEEPAIADHAASLAPSAFRQHTGLRRLHGAGEGCGVMF
jgi:hypothetical protein